MVPGKPVDKEAMARENVPAVEEGCKNLQKHIENMRMFGVPVVVAINRFSFDTDAEIEAVRAKAKEAGRRRARMMRSQSKYGPRAAKAGWSWPRR